MTLEQYIRSVKAVIFTLKNDRNSEGGIYCQPFEDFEEIEIRRAIYTELISMLENSKHNVLNMLSRKDGE